jgi:hypothetical protein
MTKKKTNKLDDMCMRYEAPKPKITAKSIEAMKIILSDEGLSNLGKYEMKAIVEGYNAGKKGK